MISGDFNKGIPLGKVTVFAGESGSGKSYICSGNCQLGSYETNFCSRDCQESTYSCCAPTKIAPIDFMYLDKDVNVQIGKLHNMKVERCGCV